MRNINKAVVHCTGSDEKKDSSFERVKLLHTGNKKTPISWGKYQTFCRGWSDIGYNFLIMNDGEILPGRPIHKKGAHCKGHNHDSIGICLIGNKEFSKEQFESYKKLKEELKVEFGLKDSGFYPHNHFNKNKTCPNFDLNSL